MAYLDNTRPHSATHHKLTLCLTEDEVKVLLPLFKKALKSAEDRYWRYLDIQESGEATIAQQNKLIEYEDKVGALKSVIGAAEELIY